MVLNPDILYSAYTQGYFPMAESADGDIYWHSPDPRAVFPIYDIKPHKSVRQLFKKNIYSFSVNRCFRDVVSLCSKREDTWISEEIIDAYTQFHKLGYAQSVEVWNDDKLCGGLYGVSIGGAFFGESMFSLEANTSKLSFYVLLAILKANNFLLLDSQFINEHTKLLGAVEIRKREYIKLLKTAINLKTSFNPAKLTNIAVY